MSRSVIRSLRDRFESRSDSITNSVPGQRLHLVEFRFAPSQQNLIEPDGAANGAEVHRLNVDGFLQDFPEIDAHGLPFFAGQITDCVFREMSLAADFAGVQPQAAEL